MKQHHDATGIDSRQQPLRVENHDRLLHTLLQGARTVLRWRQPKFRGVERAKLGQLVPSPQAKLLPMREPILRKYFLQS